MHASSLALIAAASVASAAVPGPCLILVIGRSLRDGIRGGLAVVAGIMLSKLALLALAYAMTVGLVEVTEAATAVLRVGGAGMLAFFAVGLLLTPAPAMPAAVGSASLPPCSSGVGAGLCAGLASPFNLVFMLAVLPQVAGLGTAGPAELAATAAAIALGALPPLVVAAALAAGCRGALAGAAPWVGRASALTLLSFAAAAVLPAG